ncbi:ankyrin repeat domain-containing protein [Thalassococcus sp. S3]|uniref:ankyrin repeat domain-containing protein n=1 Tax=Thalassococcus sp. S3 TaxID=2017482 RepID=UPI0013EE4B9E|nr:ankyrin repeat domain-containing protein [Thalassococcus sp. S3]
MTENLGEVSQATAAAAVRFSPSKFNSWRWHKDPSPESLKQIAKNIRDELGLPSDQDDIEANKFVVAFKFVRKVQNRDAAIDDVIPELAHSFMREMRFINAKGEPTEKLIKWLNSTPPPLAAPRYISREQAFTESEATSAIWLNPHNHYSLPLRGREAELALLDQFMNSKERFKIAALVAPSGAGKTRLVSEWAKPYIVGEKTTEWDAGFVESPDADSWSEENWQPSKNTLIIIDYTYNYADVIGALMKRFENGAPYDIRLLVLDHVLPEKLHQDTAFRKGVPSLGFREANSELFFERWPIALDPLSDTQGFLRGIIAAAADPFTEDDDAKRYKPDSPKVTSAADALMQIGAVDGSLATPDQIRRRDAVRHPLFAALLGQMIRRSPNSEFSGMTRRDLVGHYFENERRLPWRKEAQDPVLGYWVGFHVSAATLLRGISINGILEFQDNLPAISHPLVGGEDVETLLDISGRFVSFVDRHVIRPLEPDILGETFVLKFLAENRSATDYRSFASALSVFSVSNGFEDRSGSFLETIQRLVRNLLNEDQTLADVQSAWSSLLRFLNPKWFPEGSTIRRAISTGLADLIAQGHRAERGPKLTPFLAHVEIEELGNTLDKRTDVGIGRALYCLEQYLTIERLDFESQRKFVRVFDRLTRSVESSVSLLRQAAAEGTLKAAQFLKTQFDGDVNEAEASGWTSLLVATYYKNHEFVVWLLNLKADPNCFLFEDGLTPLMIAARYGEDKLLRSLLDFGADFDARTLDGGWTVLMHACVEEQTQSVRTLIEAGANLDASSFGGHTTALMVACAAGTIEIVALLIEGGANLDFVSNYGNITALSLAIEKGHFDIVQILLESGANANSHPSINAITPLVLACECGNSEIAQLLLDFGADPNRVIGDGTDTRSALSVSCSLGAEDLVDLLLSSGAEVDMPLGDSGPTPLFLASAAGQLEASKLLVSAGAEIDRMNLSMGWSPLLAASSAGHQLMVDFLIEAGADVDFVAADEETSSLVVACAGGHIGVAKRLIAANADVDRPVLSNGATILRVICHSADDAMACCLISSGASLVAVTTDDGWNPLIAACSNGLRAAANLMISAGVDVNYSAAADDGWTALMAACFAGELEIAKDLVENDAQVDKTTNDIGWTALMAASSAGHLDLVQYLTLSKASLDRATTDIGMTALMMAVLGNHAKVVNFLIEAGANTDQRTFDRCMTARDLAAEYGFFEIVSIIDRQSK